jgi:hypothetical protein
MQHAASHPLRTNKALWQKKMPPKKFEENSKNQSKKITSFFAPPTADPEEGPGGPPEEEPPAPSGLRKRKALLSLDVEEVGNRPSKVPTPRKKNPGGSSNCDWFNPMLTNPSLSGVREHLYGKIPKPISTAGAKHPECIRMPLNKDGGLPRLIANQSQRQFLGSLVPDVPAAFSAYQLAMMRAGKERPPGLPPRLPEADRQVIKARTKDDVVDKDATWVISHRCHERSCINPDHLIWEPSWYNRLRDNCPGGPECKHLDHPCLGSHRDAARVYRWTDLPRPEGGDE